MIETRATFRGLTMTQRQITFTDEDDNPLILHLAGDRAQLEVVDCCPELAGNELLAFATALFGATLAGPLADRLAAAVKQLGAVCAQLAAGSPDQAAALDAPLAAIAEVANAMAAARDAVAEQPAARPRGNRPANRLGETDGVLGWGWVRYADEASAA